MKKFLLILGAVAVAFFAWRMFKRYMAAPNIGPRQTLTPKQKWLDDNAPTGVYSTIVPPIAQNVRSNAGRLILRRNDPVIMQVYSLPAMGPNGNN